MTFTPQVVGETIAFQTPWMTVRQAQVSGPGGHSDWFYLDHPGCALVLPLTPDGHLVLLHIWRVAVGQWCWEAPAGRIEPGEEPAAAAVRELKEETGASASSVQSLGTTYSSTGSSNEQVHLFLAEGVRLGDREPSADEMLACQLFSIPQALSAAASGDIEDAATCLALLRAHHLGLPTPQRGVP